MDLSRVLISSNPKGLVDPGGVLFDSVPVALMLLDRDGKVIRANKAQCLLLGCKEDEIEEQQVWKFVAEEDEELSRVNFASGIAGEDIAMRFLCRFKTRTNEYVSCDVTVCSIPVGPDDVTMRLVTSVNVTERLAEQNSHSNQSRWLEVSFRCLPEAAIILDAIGRVRFVNEAAEQLLGWPESEVVGTLAKEVMPLRNVISADETQPEYDYRSAVAKEWSGTAVIFTRSGLPKQLRIRTAPVVTADGLVLGIAGCMREIAVPTED